MNADFNLYLINLFAWIEWMYVAECVGANKNEISHYFIRFQTKVSWIDISISIPKWIIWSEIKSTATTHLTKALNMLT